MRASFLPRSTVASWLFESALSMFVLPMKRCLATALAAVAALLAACGGGGGGETPPQTQAAVAGELHAEVGGCSVAPEAVHDSGEVLYVVVDAACTPAFPATLRLDLRAAGTGAPIASRSVAVRGLGEAVPVALPQGGTRQASVFRRGQWRSMANTGSWAARDGAGLLVLGGRLYLLGGWLHGPVTNEVWVTSDLERWQFLGHAPWAPRHGAGWVVHDERLWVIGGDLHDDVWSSPDGVTWTREAQAAPFGKRYTPNAVSHDGHLYLYAGQHWDPVDWCILRPDCVPVGRNDVWRSADGRAWERVTEAAPWSPRALVHGGIVWNGEIVVIGGGLKGSEPNAHYNETVAEFTDIWSSPDGRHWQRRSADFGFAPRTHFSVLATPGGCFVSDGSVYAQIAVSNDLYFAPDCVNFTAVPNPPTQPRHASSLAWFNGSIVLLGGPPVGEAGTVVWQYFP